MDPSNIVRSFAWKIAQKATVAAQNAHNFTIPALGVNDFYQLIWNVQFSANNERGWIILNNDVNARYSNSLHEFGRNGGVAFDNHVATGGTDACFWVSNVSDYQYSMGNCLITRSRENAHYGFCQLNGLSWLDNGNYVDVRGGGMYAGIANITQIGFKTGGGQTFTGELKLLKLFG